MDKVKRICAWCNTEFMILPTKHTKFCSQECREKSIKAKAEKEKEDAAKRVQTKLCPVCNLFFQTKYSRQVYCCKECSTVANREMARDRYVPVPAEKERFCICCGQRLTGRASKFCNDDCRRRFYKPKVSVAEIKAGIPDETENVNRCECKRKADCIYGRGLDGNTKAAFKTMYCGFYEVTGRIRGGYPDECTYYKSKKRR